MDAKDYDWKKVLRSGYKQLLLIVFCLFLTIQSNAQSQDRPIWLSFHIGHQEYRGDLGNEFLEYALGTNWVLGYQGSIYLSPSIDLGLNLSIGELDIQNGLIQGNPDLSETAFSKTYINTSLFGRFKLANGSILPENSFIQPYLNAGIGFTAFGGGDENLKNGLTLTLPATFGLDIPVHETVKLYVQSTYNRMFADGFDGNDQLDNRTHDDYMVYAAGVKIALSPSKREYREGVSKPDFSAAVPPPVDNKAKEINGPQETSALEETNKSGDEAAELTAMNRRSSFSDEIEEPEKIPFDSDGDGINDEFDSCPQMAGAEYLEGCPDADGDKVSDSKDECPKMAGKSSLRGCPDDDSDGIINSADECPGEPGLNELGGCPVRDRDNDAIVDADDECPNERGLKQLNGCPARDSDAHGITDERDDCPDEAGAEAMNGCPAEEETEPVENTETAIEEEEPVKKNSAQGIFEGLKKRVDVIHDNLQYEAGKAIFTESSKDDLSELARIMEENPKLQLIIEGYTDSKGDASYNLLLSKDRADAVKQYLLGKGIDEIRLRAEGYGEILPVTTNDTEAGRAKNRRVELRLTYHWIL